MTTNSSEDGLAEAKAALRKQALSLRRGLAPEQRAAISLAAQKHILALPAWQAANQVLLYSPVRGELDTALLMSSALASQKQVLLPRCLPEALAGRPGCMELAFCQGAEQLRPGPFNILEPDPALCPAALAADLHPDIAVVPGVAFSLRGQRLGYGGGFYDRFLAEFPLKNCLCIGFCAQIQIVTGFPGTLWAETSWPESPWDVSMDAICTESGIFVTKTESGRP